MHRIFSFTTVEDIITVFKDEGGDGWCGGETDGRIGYFPKDYVLPLGDRASEKMVKVSANASTSRQPR